jgi:hypothetical protein
MPKRSRGASQTQTNVTIKPTAPRDLLDSEKRRSTVAPEQDVTAPPARAVVEAPELRDGLSTEPSLPRVVPKIAVAQEPNLESDPEASADAFLARTRQEATQAVDALTKEAAALRKRLQQVEAALGRYRATLTALNAAQPGERRDDGRAENPKSDVPSTPAPRDPEPGLVPAPKTRRDADLPDLPPPPSEKPASDPRSDPPVPPQSPNT